MPSSSNIIANLLTVNELAAYLKISKTSVYRLIEKRQIPFYKVKGGLRFTEQDVLKYLERNRVEPMV